MFIYCVKYQTGYDYDEILGYYAKKEDAEERCKEVNQGNPGLDAYVDDIELQ